MEIISLFLQSLALTGIDIEIPDRSDKKVKHRIILDSFLFIARNCSCRWSSVIWIPPEQHINCANRLCMEWQIILLSSPRLWWGHKERVRNWRGGPFRWLYGFTSIVGLSGCGIFYCNVSDVFRAEEVINSLAFTGHKIEKRPLHHHHRRCTCLIQLHYGLNCSGGGGQDTK